MSMETFQKITKFLEDEGLETVSIEDATKQVFMNKDKNLSVTVEFDDTIMTEKDEEVVKERLRQLGYL